MGKDIYYEDGIERGGCGCLVLTGLAALICFLGIKYYDISKNMDLYEEGGMPPIIGTIVNRLNDALENIGDGSGSFNIRDLCPVNNAATVQLTMLSIEDALRQEQKVA